MPVFFYLYPGMGFVVSPATTDLLLSAGLHLAHAACTPFGNGCLIQ